MRFTRNHYTQHKRRAALAWLLALFLCLPSGFSPATAQAETAAAEKQAYVAGELLVTYNDAGGGLSLMSADSEAAQLEAAEETLKDADVSLEVEEIVAEATADTGTVALASVTDGSSVEQAVAEVAALDGVAAAQPNYIYHLVDEVSEDTIAQAEAETAADSAAAPDTEAATEAAAETTTGEATAAAVPNDPVASVYNPNTRFNQYWLYEEKTVGSTTVKGADVLDAWDLVQCNGSVTVAVFDTGVNLTHEDLQDNLLTAYAWDAYADKALKASGSFNGDHDGHGTHVCGIVAGVAGNGIEIAGVSYNARVLPVKVFNNAVSGSTASTATVVKAYQYIFDLIDAKTLTNLRVVNMSLGEYGSQDAMLHSFIATARNTYGILSVCAGGNGDSSNNPYTKSQYPSDWEECLAVTALNTDGTNAVWSDYNAAKDISAPGVSIYSTYNSGSASYARKTGTSMASPVVAGIAALCFAADSGATVEEVVAAIEETATTIDDSTDSYRRNSSGASGSAGAVNAEAAVRKMLTEDSGTAPITPSFSVNPSAVSLTVGTAGTVSLTYNGNGTVSVISGNSKVANAAYNESQKTVTVTPVAAGSTTVTVSAAATTGYLAASARISVTVTAASYSSAKTVSMYRLYNPNSGEHFYTQNITERNNLMRLGWSYEGVGWTAPASGSAPVYRLYNKNGGEHHYTMSVLERNSLIRKGWSYEGIGWYSDTAKGIPVYREYNPNAFANNHNYTTSRAEHNWLVSLGWKSEDIAFYGAK